MKIERVSENEVVIRSDKPIFTLGDDLGIVVTEHPAKKFNITFRQP